MSRNAENKEYGKDEYPNIGKGSMSLFSDGSGTLSINDEFFDLAWNKEWIIILDNTDSIYNEYCSYKRNDSGTIIMYIDDDYEYYFIYSGRV